MHGRGRLHKLAVLGLLALGLAGCGGSPRPLGNDPLVGGGPPLPTPADAARGKDQPLPAVPAPSASTSPANLASGAVPALDGDRGSLRIGENDREPGRRFASLTPPVPIAQGGVSTLPPVPIVPASSSSGQPDLFRVLELRGVKGFRLELKPDSGQWRCICSIPDSQNPKYKQNYEATANDPQAAMQSILDKIDRGSR